MSGLWPSHFFHIYCSHDLPHRLILDPCNTNTPWTMDEDASTAMRTDGSQSVLSTTTVPFHTIAHRTSPSLIHHNQPKQVKHQTPDLGKSQTPKTIDANSRRRWPHYTGRRVARLLQPLQISKPILDVVQSHQVRMCTLLIHLHLFQG